MTLRQRIRATTPYIILVLSVLPMFMGYFWLLLSSFSTRTEGLLPVGNLTLEHFSFLIETPFGRGYPSIWRVTFNTFLIASLMTVTVVLVSALAGYALSRLNFPGRRPFLSLTLILHAFPSVTLLIGIFFVLRAFKLYNTILGVGLVMVGFEMPFGIWLMKGFFDNVSWDMERAALIDGANRLQVWWQIILPTIKPSMAALALFAFISGWNAWLIPKTFTIGAGQQATLSVYLQNFQGDTVAVDWGAVTAVGLFQLVPVAFFFIFTQDLLLSIYAGGSKGGS
ncbi:ABC transporter, permease protein 2 (cluster 1, maltose/g3p/polyamine/iron) [hydrothermal vent metagenome]|uniref:ABC transporter, permease protein 2 (Cluster 1, maltose/g3p/polyamine/iron) n=1 Tax=hydrothermal vent metagenome TaxID=652676 RepID=A0A3B0V148_9ZZZZ